MLNNVIDIVISAFRPLVLAGGLMLACALTVSAQDTSPGSDRAPDAAQAEAQLQKSPVQESQPRPDNLPAVFDGVGIDEKLGDTPPLSLSFKDETGADVTLSDYFDNGRPVLLNFAYHKCPMLCSIMLESFAQTLQELELGVGEEFDVVTVSFSASETPDLAARQKEKYLQTVDRPRADEGWHFLTGSEENIQALAAATGFKFKWVESSKEYAHPAALIFLSEEGVITRYLHGMVFPTLDVRRAIVEASRGEIGTALDRIIMYCYRYDATANSYVIHAQSLMKIAGLLTLILIGLALTIFWKRERQRHKGKTPAQRAGVTEFG